MELPVNRKTVADAIEYLKAGLTVTEGQWPRRVIDSLEDRYLRRDDKERWHIFSPAYMGRTYPKGCRPEGLRWFNAGF